MKAESTTTQVASNTTKKVLFIFLPILILAIVIISAVMLLTRDKFTPPQGEIWQVTDIHYLSKTLVEDEEYFKDLMNRSDGKVTFYISELYDALEAKALEEKPEAIIFTGDLTLNGAVESHKELAKRLETLKAAGIKVLVIPGNHDIALEAYKFTSEGPVPIDSATPEEFKEIYGEFGYNDAVSKDEDTFSYIYEISEGFHIVMLDVNSEIRGTVPDKTLKWLEEQLALEKKQKNRVISATHQNCLVHNSNFTFGYVLNNAQDVLDLYSKYGVKLNLSGHMHHQNIEFGDTLAEVAASSVAVCPNQFGVLKFTSKNKLDYSVKKVDVSSWAAKNNLTNPDLLNFEDYAKKLFDISNSGKIEQGIKISDPALREEIVNLSLTLNRQYFAGHIEVFDTSAFDRLTAEEAKPLSYILSLKARAGIDNTRAEFTIH